MTYCPECGKYITDPQQLIQHMIVDEHMTEEEAIARLLSIGLINEEDI